MDELISEATKKGMYLVDHDDTEALLTEYEEKIAEADALCEIVDPESKPYESKYKAREILDQIINKLDATRAIASLERKKSTMDDMDFRIAAARVQVGTISWECEEPHNAQTELELACEFYFPGLVKLYNETVTGTEEDNQNEPKKNANTTVEPSKMPVMPSLSLLDSMKCLNILGILWAGRGQVQRSMLFLLSANNLYSVNIDTTKKERSLSAKLMEDLGYVYTHNIFYLAQAYGNIGDTKKSCYYCHLTLQRQFAEGFRDSTTNGIKPALDWVKNCCGLSDFYLAMKQYCNCSLALASAEFVMKKFVITKILEVNTSNSDSSCNMKGCVNGNFISGNLNALEMEADLHRKWAMLDVFIMRKAFEKASNIQTGLSIGMSVAEARLAADQQQEEEDGTFAIDDFDLAVYQTAKLLNQQDQPQMSLQDNAATALMPPPPPPPSASNDSSNIDDVSISSLLPPPPPPSVISPAVIDTKPAVNSSNIEFFVGIPVRLTSYHSSSSSKAGGNETIASFEDARRIFLRAAARIEAAKKYYVLDGYVTDHVVLTQEHSKLYHYLSIFENDCKRRLAMEQRRCDLLMPLLKALNRSSYEVLHKQVSYELGECALCMLDIKLDKFREREATAAAASTAGNKVEINERTLKKAEIVKCNDYCKQGISMFAHFTYMYAETKPKDTSSSSNCTIHQLELLPLYELAHCGCIDPDIALISEEEVRPFLNAHFLSCRIMSKIIPTALYLPPTTTTTTTKKKAAEPNRAHYLVACLRRYEWLCKFTKQLCARRGLVINDVFGDELRICEEMVRLLPSKIDRMCYLGESGLSL